MGKKDKDKGREPRTCPRCHGEGGWWEVGNGPDFKGGKRRFRICPLCNGSGKTA